MSSICFKTGVVKQIEKLLIIVITVKYLVITDDKIMFPSCGNKVDNAVKMMYNKLCETIAIIRIYKKEVFL